MSGEVVKLSEETAHWSSWYGRLCYEGRQAFPRDVETIVMLAVCGRPYHHLMPPTAYVVSVNCPSIHIRSFFDIERNFLHAKNGSAICWRPKGSLTPESGLRSIRDYSLNKADNLEKLSGGYAIPIYRQILNYWSQGSTKRDIKLLFPSLSERQFDRLWRQAADIQPELSKPGRKS